MEETPHFLHTFAVESVYFSENINNSTTLLEDFKYYREYRQETRVKTEGRADRYMKYGSEGI